MGIGREKSLGGRDELSEERLGISIKLLARLNFCRAHLVNKAVVKREVNTNKIHISNDIFNLV